MRLLCSVSWGHGSFHLTPTPAQLKELEKDVVVLRAKLEAARGEGLCAAWWRALRMIARQVLVVAQPVKNTVNDSRQRCAASTEATSSRAPKLDRPRHAQTLAQKGADRESPGPPKRPRRPSRSHALHSRSQKHAGLAQRLPPPRQGRRAVERPGQAHESKPNSQDLSQHFQYYQPPVPTSHVSHPSLLVRTYP